MLKKQIFLLLISFLSCSLHAEEFIHYKVKKKDYLSSILYSLDIAPIYGKRGYLKKVVALNAKKVKKHGDIILEGTDLLLPLSVASKVLAKDVPVQIEPEIVVSASETKIEPEPFRSIAEVLPPEIVTAPFASIVETPPAKKELESTDIVLNNQYEKAISIDPFQQKSFFKLAPTFSLLGIGAIDSAKYGRTDITDSTKPSIGVYGEWRILITPKAESYIFASVNSLSFYGDSSYGLKDTKFTNTSFGVGSDYKLNTTSQIGVNAQISQNYFLEVMSPTDIQIRSISQVELTAKYKRVLFSIDKVNADWGLSGLVILPSSRGSYKGKMGYGYKADVTTKFLTKEIEFSYVQKYFKINSSRNQSQEVQAKLNFSFGAEQ